MKNIIPENARVIIATFKIDPLKKLGTLALMPAACTGGWAALLKNETFGNILTRDLENNDICDIHQCFSSYREYCENREETNEKLY